MAEGSALALGRGHATICLPFEEDEYQAIVDAPKRFRRRLDGRFAEMPELFPEGFGDGYAMKDARTSRKQGVPIRRITHTPGVFSREDLFPFRMASPPQSQLASQQRHCIMRKSRSKKNNDPLNCWLRGFGFLVVSARFSVFFRAAFPHDPVPLLGCDLAWRR